MGKLESYIQGVKCMTPKRTWQHRLQSKKKSVRTSNYRQQTGSKSFHAICSYTVCTWITKVHHIIQMNIHACGSKDSRQRFVNIFVQGSRPSYDTTWEEAVRGCTIRGYDFYFYKYHVINHMGNWLGTCLDKLWMNKEKFTRAWFEPATSRLTLYQLS